MISRVLLMRLPAPIENRIHMDPIGALNLMNFTFPTTIYHLLILFYSILILSLSIVFTDQFFLPADFASTGANGMQPTAVQNSDD